MNKSDMGLSIFGGQFNLAAGTCLVIEQPLAVVLPFVPLDPVTILRDPDYTLYATSTTAALSIA